MSLSKLRLTRKLMIPAVREYLARAEHQQDQGGSGRLRNGCKGGCVLHVPLGLHTPSRGGGPASRAYTAITRLITYRSTLPEL